MVFKRDNDESAKSTGNNAVVPLSSGGVSDSNTGAVKNVEPDMRIVNRHVRGIQSRKVNGGYIIEPVKRPANHRLRMLTAILLVMVLLTGSLSFYADNLVDAYSSTLIKGSSGSWGNKKASSSYSSNDISVPDGKLIPVELKATSVERDMRVRIIGEDEYPIVGYRFEIELTYPDGDIKLFANDARDGRFSFDQLEGGDYVVTMVPAEGYETPAAIEVEVVDKVQFVEIDDISDMIVSQNDIDSSTDDPQFSNTGNPDAGTPSVPEKPKDTVQFVESRVVEKEENVRYTARVDENGRLFARDGTLTDIVPIFQDGYMTGDYTIYEEIPGEPDEPDEPDEPEPEIENGEGGEIDLFEKDTSGNYIFDITRHADVVLTYYGWQDINSNRYYYDSRGVRVTGNQIIQGKSYTFSSEGVLLTSSGTLNGIDVSTWQDIIDWKKVKAAGIDFVMIRAGFRGYSTGQIVEDNQFYNNLKGAKAAGLRVGIYFFSQAVTEVEGVEEASMVISLIKKYGIYPDYPITIDSEWSGAPGNTGRADNLSRSQRTAVCVAFCETIRSAGYTPMIYASKSWFENNLSVGSFGSYKIWLAHYTPNGETSSYSGRYEMWQYTSKGSVNGISGNVDMNYGYLGY